MIRNADILAHFTELDRSVLDASEAYTSYFEYLRKTFTKLQYAFNDRTTDQPLEVEIVHLMIQRMLNTVEALRLKFAFEEEHPLKIDRTDSSFPNFMELKTMGIDLERKETVLARIPNEESLKHAVLDHLFTKKSIPYELLKQLSKLYYHQFLSEEKVYLQFTPGTLTKMPDGTDRSVRWYNYFWGTYDPVTNRPNIYILLFEHDIKGSRNHFVGDKDLEIYVEGFKNITKSKNPLRIIAHDIDEAFDFLRPKVLKRIDIGPIYGQYSKDHHPLTKVLQGKNGEEDYAMLFTTEVVYSVGETQTKSFLSDGRVKQVFYIDESDLGIAEQRLSDLKKHIIAPHSVIQLLRAGHEDILSEFNTEPITAATDK